MRSFLSLFSVVLFVPTGLAPAAPPAAQVEFFEKQVRPVLAEKCYSCHGPKAQRGGLRVDSREALLKGGDSGPGLRPGQPDASLIVKAVRRHGELKMPPRDRDRLEEKAILALAEWVRMGAPWPAEAGVAAVSPVELARKTHWSFRPVQRPVPPTVRNPSWPITPVDQFLLARLEQKDLDPSPPAERRILLRRVTFDLTGLPPTPEEVEGFVSDTHPDAYERVVERLLASPAHGERWGRHWLDVARYADTKGYVFQEERRYPYSYTYRDWVINALNEDLPYDRFVLEQLAADRLVQGQDRRALAAMGFLTLGRRFLNNTHDIIDDRIDVVTRGLLGLTVSCARCHDHKYDPIPSRDYYSLYGVFASSRVPTELPLLETPDATAPPSAFETELRKRQGELESFERKQRAELVARFRAQAADYLLAIRDGRAVMERRGRGELNRTMLVRWRDFLLRAGKGHHPVLEPWLAFARLPEKEFATAAAALAQRIAANATPARPVNPLVARAFTGKPPASLAEVAEKYRMLFREAEGHWQQQLQKDSKSSRLDNPAQEALRQVLHGTNSPVNIPQGDLRPYLDRAQRNRFTALKRRVDQWLATGPGGPARAMVLVDTPSPFNPQVFLRGNPNNRGIAVPRQFLEVLSPQRRPFTDGSGRLELARAIASAANPLTARVMVNRVWMHHFGTGIVRTPGDFGTRGELPTHPELLDWLAAEFVESGWSLKRLHRLIVTSAAYRQSSDEAVPGRGPAVDPENTLLWRMPRRRLELEPLRDALLAVAGRLDRRMGGPGVEITRTPFPPRRSVYAFIERQNLPGVFRTFDLASPDVSTPQRYATTVPQQSLFLMNSPFVHELARRFAARTAHPGEGKDDAARIDQLHRLAYGRPAEADEVAAGVAFVRGVVAGEKSGLGAWEQYAQVLLLANEFAFVD